MIADFRDVVQVVHCRRMKLTFYGATEQVTGSCFLLETDGAKILVDCGAVQGERMCSKTNLEDFAFDPKTIDAVLVTHAHFDHTGRLPQLVARGFAGKIFMTPPTKGITDIVLEDSLNVMRDNAKKCGDAVPFNSNELAIALSRMVGVNYHTAFQPAPGMTATFFDAGHILGSSFIAVDVDGKRIVFSGDIGNSDVPILPDTEAISHADVVVCESTYGSKDHEPMAFRSDALAEFVRTVIGRGGTVLIPAFSVERTQEILYELDLLITAKKIPAVPFYLDSPLAIRATALYHEYASYLHFDHPASMGGDFFAFPSLHSTLSQSESMAINNDRRPKVIIAGNGMMTGGRILHHMTRYLSDEKSGLLIVGFQAPFTMGRQIQEGAKSVTIHGERVAVAATVHTIEAFSAHGDRQKIAKWLHPKTGAAPKVFLTHGENDTKASFKTYLAQHDITDVTIPKVTQMFEL